MKAEDYRDRQASPPHERMAAVSQMTLFAYQVKWLSEMFDDLRELSSIFHVQNVKYLIVGGKESIPFPMTKSSVSA
jgi:hypothetical protein